MRKIKLSLINLIIINFIILLISSIIRHRLFQSNALDLGWFDQGVYLISQGKNPIISFVDYHILGDHAAFILYPIALLYKIYNSVYWLLAIQALALSLGAFPIYQLSLQADLKHKIAITLSTAYLLYPLIFNVNLFDFHPDVIAVPALLWAVLAARSNSIIGFLVAIVIVLSCKAIFSLTVAAMGIWLLLFEKKRLYGSIAIILGIAWFILSTQVIIPILTGNDAAIEMADSRYSYLGNSVGEIIKNIFLKPNLILGKLFSLANLEYIIFLFIPVIWGLSPRYLSPLIAAIPTLALNLITDYLPQKNLTNQYSLTIIPFLFIAVIATEAAGKGWLKRPKYIILWSLVAFIALAKYGYFGSIYLKTLDTWQATQKAVSLVNTSGGVLTNSAIAPHLTHRPLVKLAIQGSETLDLKQFDHILLNKRHPGWSSSPELIQQFITRLEQIPEFKLTYQQDEVFLYQKSLNITRKKF
ncbi:hypothetical protein C7H19_15525 [Aphanothece hegewaldii CCALA 016]|uniref:DUF2079 domain-containing protein n=1 Tax=Aphanothece hegewaldii CCALA 016 TaxID=2107694 RepID=A0A2T1LVA9_9CHRO|nr:DUF2079 domain-containing protein [Aphanothece hegewaldii]PSF35651.1 hypothetical protein C7H19_15525 [Aphanothece hegewaldii CCALA 016]